jgi:hypothetical protein
MPISEKTNFELIQVLEKFGQDNSKDSPYSFSDIVDELERRGPSASETAPVLAKAMAFNGTGSVTASRALIAMGPSAKSAIPYLLQNLDNSRAEVRSYSVFVLGTIGEPSSCAIPELGPLLWDEDSVVRSTTAGALTEILRIELLEDELYKLDPSMPGSVFVDEPDGKISGMARKWWLKTGQNMKWTTENCELRLQ